MDYKPTTIAKIISKRHSLIKILIITFMLLTLLFIAKNILTPSLPSFTTTNLNLPVVELQDNKKQLTDTENNWQVIKIKLGDTITTILTKLHISNRVIQTILTKNPYIKQLTSLKPDKEIKIQINNNELQQIVVPYSDTENILIYKENDNFKTKILPLNLVSQNNYLTARIHGSLYNTAKRYNLPFKLIQEMEEIFNWNIDFRRDIKENDQFTMLYKAYYVKDKLVRIGDIIAITYKTAQGKIYQAIRHKKDNGSIEYYTPDGISLKKAFTRYPINFSHISSTFQSEREHPILHYKRPHKGIDLAAPIGTPIHATGDGKIVFIGRQSGYGNMIEIDHNRGFNTIYGHMLRFQKGLTLGETVTRGQIIGYVGQSGLANGPHCHYEFHINNKAKNPATITLPKGEPIDKKNLPAFQDHAANLLAQLKLFEEAQHADEKKEV